MTHFQRFLRSLQPHTRTQSSWHDLPTPYSPVQDLPVELIQEIFQFIDPPGLCQLAMTCHDLHFIALQCYFRRFGLRDVSDEICISHLNADVLPALRLSLFITSVNRFVWQAGGPKTWVGEVKQIKRFLSKLHFVGKMELDFSDGTNFGWTEKDVKMMNTKKSRPWIKMCTNFLHLAAQKARSLEIRNHILSTRNDSGETMKNAIRFPSSGVRRLSAAFDDIPITSCLPMYNRPQFPPYVVTELILNDSSLFRNPSFLGWSFQWINNMPIKRLVLMQGDVRLPLLTRIHLSATLSDFTLHHKNDASMEDINVFLHRHPGLTTRLNSTS